MSSAEITEWMAFSTLEPFGGDIDFIGTAIVAQVVANTHLNKNQKPYKTDAFIPKWHREEQSVNQQMQFAEMLTIAMGGTVTEDE